MMKRIIAERRLVRMSLFFLVVAGFAIFATAPSHAFLVGVVDSNYKKMSSSSSIILYSDNSNESRSSLYSQEDIDRLHARAAEARVEYYRSIGEEMKARDTWKAYTAEVASEQKSRQHKKLNKNPLFVFGKMFWWPWIGMVPGYEEFIE
jgi:hypothetical protein